MAAFVDLHTFEKLFKVITRLVKNLCEMRKDSTYTKVWNTAQGYTEDYRHWVNNPTREMTGKFYVCVPKLIENMDCTYKVLYTP